MIQIHQGKTSWVISDNGYATSLKPFKTLWEVDSKKSYVHVSGKKFMLGAPCKN